MDRTQSLNGSKSEKLSILCTDPYSLVSEPTFFFVYDNDFNDDFFARGDVILYANCKTTVNRHNILDDLRNEMAKTLSMV